MCGFVGVLTPSRDEAEAGARAALASIRHRGPDDSGYATVQLGDRWLSVTHTRLAILDITEAGRQPMIRGKLPPGSRATRVPVSGERDDGVGIVFNGEIYNFPALHSELLKASPPQPFQSRCDTEAVLHGVAREGLDYVRRLRGMFSFALWEPNSARLHLVRDRLGIKPLYYAQVGDRLLFGSEVRALLATGLLPREINRNGLHGYLAFGACQDPDMLIAGVNALEPSHTLTFENGREVARRRYWHLPVQINRGISIGEAREETRRLVTDAVKSHLLSDVRVGAFLSGGVDSSIIVGLMAQAGMGPLHAVTVVSDDGDRDVREEAEFAALVTRRYGIEHHVLHLSASVAEEHVRHAVEMMDQPTLDGLNTFVVSGAARAAGCPVALSGLGADEVFGGYTTFRTLAGLRRLSQLFGMSSVGAMIRDAAGLSNTRVAKLGDLLASGGDLPSIVASQRALFVPGTRAAVLRPEYRFGNVDQPNALSPDETPEDPLNFLAAYELRGYLQNMLLRDCDGLSMAHSLEVRVPFLDHPLVEFALSLPGSMRSTLWQSKSLLRAAMKPLLPPAIYRRAKVPFSLALPQWMKTSLRPQVEATLLKDNPVLDSAVVGRMWQSFILTGDNRLGQRIWGLYALSAWLNRHVFQTASPIPEPVPASVTHLRSVRGN